MRISKSIVKYWLSFVTIGFFDDHAKPSGDMEEFAPVADSLLIFMQQTHNLPWLKLAIETLLSDPEIDLREYNGGQFPFRAREMRALLEFLWQRYWPEDELPVEGGGPAVELAAMSNEEWEAEKADASPSMLEH